MRNIAGELLFSFERSDAITFAGKHGLRIRFFFIAAAIFFSLTQNGHGRSRQPGAPANSSVSRAFTLTADAKGAGHVALAPGGGVYESGTVVTVTAIPDSGHRFVDWDGDLDGPMNPTTIVMNADRTVTADFRELPRFELTVDIIGSGKVDLEPPGGIYYAGSEVVLTAIPEPGFVHTGWSGDLNGYANPGTITIGADQQVSARFTVVPEPLVETGVWTSAAELSLLPTSGVSWDRVKSVADETTRVPNLSNQDDPTNVGVLAKALVYARTGQESYRAEVVAACMAAIGTEAGGRTLALGRELSAYVIAADLIGLPPEQDVIFREWLRAVLKKNLSGRTLQSTHEDRPNNWGTQCGASRAAVAVYLGDPVELARCALIFKGYLGDRDSYAGFKYGDLSWQADPGKPVGINPAGSTLNGHSVDGVLPDDQNRAGIFDWPPPLTNYAYEGLQGALAQAVILSRAGYDVWNWQDKALLRAMQWLYSQADFPAGNDDIWLPAIVNHHYKTRFAAPIPTRPGKNLGWTDWTFGGPFGLSVEIMNPQAGAVELNSLGADSAGLQMVELTAIPNPGFAFQRWRGGPGGSANPDTVTLKTDMVVRVDFMEKFELTVTTFGDGQVILSPPGGIYNRGAVVTLTATPDFDFVFAGWSGNLDGQNDTETLVMDSNKRATATFVGGTTETFTFQPTDDGQVKSTRPRKNYGQKPSFRLELEADVRFNSYLKFNIANVVGGIESARIKLFVISDSDAGGAIYSVSNREQGVATPWNEGSLNWRNAPEISGTALNSIGAVSLGQTVEFDVTSTISSNGIYSFGLTTISSNTVEYSSKEGSRPPELVVVANAGGSNHPPVAFDDTVATVMGHAVIIDVAANDLDSDGAVEPRTVEIVAQPTNGATVIDHMTGLVTYAANNGFIGADRFSYLVRDNQGAGSNVATVSITVHASNSAPTARDDLASTNEDVSVVVAVSENDRDLDGTLDLSTLAIISGPENGRASVEVATGSISYTPRADFFGQDSLKYTVQDGLQAISNIATVRVEVKDVNDPPVALPDFTFTFEDEAIAIEMTTNDSDVDGTLNMNDIEIVTPPRSGSASIDPHTGLISYMPIANFAGADSLEYTVGDDDGAASNPALVVVTVNEVNDAPKAANDSAVTIAGLKVNVAVLANDLDIDGTLDAATIELTSQPNHGVAAAGAVEGFVVYTPDSDFAGTDEWSYTVRDDDGALSNMAVVKVRVTVGGDRQSLTFQSKHDGQVKLTAPGSNYGKKPTAKVEAGRFNAYFKFDVTGVRAPILSAILRLRVSGQSADGSEDGGSVHLVSNSFVGAAVPWVEQELTSGNAPLITGEPLSAMGAVSPDEVVAFDVSSAISGNGTYSFSITNASGDRVKYLTKESDYPPELKIETVFAGEDNSPPVARDDSSATDQGFAVIIDVLANDTDNDRNLDPTTVTIIRNPSDGAASPDKVTGAIVYTPNAGFAGADTFAYSVSDIKGAKSNVATVFVAVNPTILRLTKISGDKQVGSIAGTLAKPFVVEVRDGRGNQIEAVKVSFKITKGGGALSHPKPQATDANGRASTFLTLGTTPGQYTVRALSHGLVDSPQFFSATALGFENSPPMDVQTFTFFPTEDAQVKLTQPRKKYAFKTTSDVQPNTFISYLKFEVFDVTGSIQNVVIRLRVADPGAAGGSVYSVSNNFDGTNIPWVQTGLTAETAPKIAGAPLSSLDKIDLNTHVEFDVTPAISGTGSFSFAIRANGGGRVAFHTREEQNRPELIIRTGASNANKRMASNEEAAPTADISPEIESMSENLTVTGIEAVPDKIELRPNYPNPFNAGTTIEYAVPETAKVRMLIFNVKGQLVRRLVDGEQPAGYKKIYWSGNDTDGVAVGSGIYFVQLEVGRTKLSRRIILQK